MPFQLDLIPPVPNLNGNTKGSLIEPLVDLMHKLRATEEAIVACHDCWHGRNFVPQGSDEANLMRSLAEGAWRLRMITLAEMHAEIVRLIQKIEHGDTHEDEAPTEPLVDDGVPKGWDEVEGGPSTDEPEQA